MEKTSSGLYTIQAGMLTTQGFNNNPDVLPIGIAIMTALVLAVLGTLYMLRKLFMGRDVSKDVKISENELGVSVKTAAPRTSIQGNIVEDKGEMKDKGELK